MYEATAPTDTRQADQSGRGRCTRGTAVLFSLLTLLLIHVAPAHGQHRIEGRVTDDLNGQPVAGVQVMVQGTEVGTLTDQSGRYQLTAPTSIGTLRFTRLGYEPLSVTFNNQTVLNAVMTTAATEIEGIVAIGYGERSRVNLTESVGTVSSREIQQVAVSSPDQAIQGRVTGVDIQSQSGAPGAPTAIRIRGVGTIGNAQPLFIIDGVPVGRGTDPASNPMATINPSDIESISVLKDASAAAVYGVQAANGVVLITTRRGRIGKPSIQYDGYQGAQQMPRYYDLLNTDQWYALMQEAIANSNAYYGRQPGEPDYAQLPINIRPQNWDPDLGAWVDNPRYNPALLERNTDWQRVPLNPNAAIMNHNLSVSGATEQVNYFVSAGFFKQDAIQHKWDLDRISFRANSDFQINDRIRFGETFSISNQFTLRGHHNWGDGRILANSLPMAPIAVFRDPDCPNAPCEGNRYGFASNADVFDGGLANHAGINHILDVEDRSTRVIGGLHGEIDVLPGLTFRTQGNLDYRIGKFYQWNPGYAQAEVGLDRNVPVAEEARSENIGVVLTNTLTYDGVFGAHSLNVLGGIETQQNQWSNVSLRRDEFLSTEEAIRRIVGVPGALAGGWAGENAFLGYLGRVTYNFGDRYLVTASVRRDGASEFAPGHQWGTFPAISAGWRVSQEPFFKLSWVDELKLRGSWGRMGNSAIPGGAYPHLLAIGPNSTYTLNGTRDAMDVPIPLSRFPNAGLTWETTTTTDFGFEGAVLANSIDFSATYYDRSTGGFLLPVDLPPSSGFLTSPFNSGRVTNRGVELELGYNAPRLFGELDVRVGGNLTTVRNRLEELAPGMEQYAAPGDNGVQAFAQHYRTAPGYPVGYFYGFKTCGIYRTSQEAAQAPTDVTIDGRRPGAGDMCFVDVNADGEITNADRTYIGSSIADGYFGLNLNATFRRFDLTTFFSGVYGVQKYNQVRRSLESMGGGTANQMTTTLDRWTPENPNASMPRAIAGDPAGNNRFSDRWVEDAGYMRLRTLQIGYTLPQGALGTNNTRVYLSGQNLFTLTGYSGYDPEFTTSIDNWRSRNDLALFQGTDSGDMPQPRMWQVGVSTSF